MDELKIPTSREVSMLIDTATCMSIYLFAKVCSKAETDDFFEATNVRLKEQRFTTEEIDKHIEHIKEIVLKLKDDLGG